MFRFAADVGTPPRLSDLTTQQTAATGKLLRLSEVLLTPLGVGRFLYCFFFRGFPVPVFHDKGS